MISKVLNLTIIKDGLGKHSRSGCKVKIGKELVSGYCGKCFLPNKSSLNNGGGGSSGNSDLSFGHDEVNGICMGYDIVLPICWGVYRCNDEKLKKTLNIEIFKQNEDSEFKNWLIKQYEIENQKFNILNSSMLFLTRDGR